MTDAALTARSSRVSLLQLGRVESRKMIDTRAGICLVLLTALSAAAAVVADVAGDGARWSLGAMFSDAMLAAGVLLPVVAILLMTSEWSQRTALSTFALVPVRERVVAAKFLAVLGLLAGTTIVCLVLASVGAAIDGGSFTIGSGEFARTVLYGLLHVMFGFALAAILMNTPAAIVLNYIAGLIVAGIAALSDSVENVVVWIDPSAFGALTDATTSSLEWQRIASAAGFWIVLPIVLGVLYLRRRDIS